MPSIPQRLYNQVMMADDFTCVYCGLRTPDVQVDHIIPRQVGGPDVLHNLVAACPPCNSRKRDHQLHEVGMRLRHGRFGRTASRPTKRRIIAPVDYPIPEPANRPKMTAIEYEQRITELALERDDEGVYRFSANKIRAIVGGNEARVKSQVAALRRPSD